MRSQTRRGGDRRPVRPFLSGTPCGGGTRLALTAAFLPVTLLLLLSVVPPTVAAFTRAFAPKGGANGGAGADSEDPPAEVIAAERQRALRLLARHEAALRAGNPLPLRAQDIYFLRRITSAHRRQ